VPGGGGLKKGKGWLRKEKDCGTGAALVYALLAPAGIEERLTG